MYKTKFMIFLIIAMISCGGGKNSGTLNSDESVTEDTETLQIVFDPGDSADSVTTQITLPANGENDTTITWATDNPEIIDTDGRVTPPLPESGDATVTLTATVTKGDQIRTKVFVLTVKETPTPEDAKVTGIKIDHTSAVMPSGITYQLTASVIPSYAVNREVTWSSDAPDVVIVSETGLLTALTPGNATVMVAAADGGFTSICNVKVTEPSADLPGDIIITEFMANPKTVPDIDGEWIEIYNTTSRDLSLDGLIITRGVSKYPLTQTGLVINAKSYFVIAKRDSSLSKLPVVNAVAPISLANTGPQTLTIKSADLILDEVSYSADALDGKSFQASAGKLNHIDNNSWSSWCECGGSISPVNSDKGTPGGENVTCP